MPAVEGKLLKIIEKSRKKNLRIFVIGDAPYAPCLATTLDTVSACDRHTDRQTNEFTIAN